MSSVEIGTLIAVVGCFVGLAGWLAGRDKRIANDAQWRGTVDTKLDLIVGVKNDVAVHEHTLSGHGERITAVESSAKQAHLRIDELVKK